MFLLQPDVLRGGILFRAMVPLEPPAMPDLAGRRIYLSAGRFDSMIPAPNVERLATMLKGAGADVSLAWTPTGHNLVPDEVDAARRWFTGSVGGLQGPVVPR
jgi:phospholipase/carboxylesterase